MRKRIVHDLVDSKGCNATCIRKALRMVFGFYLLGTKFVYGMAAVYTRRGVAGSRED